MKRKIAFISEHASPLAALGGVDSGGQNVYVGELAKQMAGLGYEVDIFTRWDDDRFPEIIEWTNGIKIIHVKAGPVDFVPKEEMMQYMDEFTDIMLSYMKQYNTRYKMIHAHFFMSGYAAARIKKEMGIPFVITFHALGKVRKQHQKNDSFPRERDFIEKSVMEEAEVIVAECPQDREDMIEMYGADAKKITIIPCGYNPNEFFPIDKLFARTVLDLHPKDTSFCN